MVFPFYVEDLKVVEATSWNYVPNTKNHLKHIFIKFRQYIIVFEVFKVIKHLQTIVRCSVIISLFFQPTNRSMVTYTKHNPGLQSINDTGSDFKRNNLEK